MKTFLLAATVAAGVICSANTADAQYRRRGVVVLAGGYSNYAYPAYGYSNYGYPAYSSGYYIAPSVAYSPTYESSGVVVTSGYTPTYSSGVIYSGGLSSYPAYPSYYGYPNYGYSNYGYYPRSRGWRR